MKIIYVLLCVLQINYIKCANILGVFPFAGKSHFILGSALMRLLADKGHNITMIAPYKENTIPKSWKYEEIILDELVELHERNTKNLFNMPSQNVIKLIKVINQMSSDIINGTFNNIKVQNLLKSDQTFDVVIVESFVFDAINYFAHHFKAPLVLFSSMWSNSHLNKLVGNSFPVSYMPIVGEINHQKFFDRLKNLFISYVDDLYYKLYYIPTQTKLIRNIFPNAPVLSDIKVDLGLMNAHPSINLAMPYVPNMIGIAGFHIKPAKKLPDNLQKILDEAKDGVIYFSLGSNLKSTDLPEEKRQAFLRSFKKLKEKVLWKWENETMSDKPANVEIRKWLPQQDILAHPNVKLFITHGGLLSTTETIHYGVPILAIPVYGDQMMNAVGMERKGYGLALPYSELNEEILDKKLNKILNNNTYRDNIRRGSIIYHDRPENPSDLAVYWVEYIARHKKIDHLKVGGLDLTWYQNALLDAYLFVILILIILIFIIKICLKLLFNKCRRNIHKNKQE